MRLFKLVATLAVVIGLVTVASAAGSGGGPPAHIAGGDAGPLLYPSLVNVRLVRGEAALQRAVEYADEGQADKAVASLANARLHVRKAWAGAKYLIDNAPATPAQLPARACLTSRRATDPSSMVWTFPRSTALTGRETIGVW